MTGSFIPVVGIRNAVGHPAPQATPLMRDETLGPPLSQTRHRWHTTGWPSLRVMPGGNTLSSICADATSIPLRLVTLSPYFWRDRS